MTYSNKIKLLMLTLQCSSFISLSFGMESSNSQSNDAQKNSGNPSTKIPPPPSFQMSHKNYTESQKKLEDQWQTIEKDNLLESLRYLLKGKPELVYEKFKNFSAEIKKTIHDIQSYDKVSFLSPKDVNDLKKSIKVVEPYVECLIYLNGFSKDMNDQFYLDEDFKKFADMLYALFKDKVPSIMDHTTPHFLKGLEQPA